MLGTLPGCRFASRCPSVQSACHTTPQSLDELAPAHWVRCMVAEQQRAWSAERPVVRS